MAKKKVVRKTSTKRTKKAVKRKTVSREKEPEYMVQVNDPKNARKNILESLREVIIFMQSYEKFRHVQEEKVRLFSELKVELKVLNSLLTGKLKFYFPQGKLRAITGEAEDKYEDHEEATYMKSKSAPEAGGPSPAVHHELDELESQLKDIESQLQSIQ